MVIPPEKKHARHLPVTGPECRLTEPTVQTSEKTMLTVPGGGDSDLPSWEGNTLVIAPDAKVAV